MATVPYADATFADSYFGEIVGADAWAALLTAAKTKALQNATRLIDTLQYAGYKTVDTQANEFPRNGETAVPNAVKEACCEVAYALTVEGRTLNSAYPGAGISSESAGGASISYAEGGEQAMLGAAGGLPSLTAFRLLSEYLADPSEVTMMRTG